MTDKATVKPSLFKVLATNGMGFELNSLIVDIAKACKKISQAIRRAEVEANMGSVASTNVQGEQQKQLDLITNKIFIETHQYNGLVAGVASEELTEAITFDKKYRRNAKFLVLFDPLDGSANVSLNMAVGTIFSVLAFDADTPNTEDFLQPGAKQLCAGYALYGTSTTLVVTTGQGVNGFTLDEESGEFVLTHPNIQLPKETDTFAINMSNYRFWPKHIQRYVGECVQGIEGPRAKDFNMRWTGAMVADVHRVLMNGGIYLYPMDSKNAKLGGRLRLMYEVNPMAFLIEQAGGMAITDILPVMNVKPTSLHQRSAIVLGVTAEVERVQRYYMDALTL